jgi:hypothetical protein
VQRANPREILFIVKVDGVSASASLVNVSHGFVWRQSLPPSDPVGAVDLTHVLDQYLQDPSPETGGNQCSIAVRLVWL